MTESPTQRPLALITGASSGIGAAFAHALAGRGYDLILVARRVDLLTTLAAEIEQQTGRSADVLPADLATESGIAAVEACIHQTDRLTMLVNNAGFGLPGGLLNVPRSRLLDMIQVHVVATTRLTHAALPQMIARGQGDIINLASTAAFMKRGGGVMYSATKAFVNSFTSNLVHEVAESGIRLQALSPGFTWSGFHDTPDYEGAAFSRDSIPGLFWDTADDVVRVSLHALERGRVIVVPFWYNQLVVAGMKNPLLGRLMGLARRLIHSGRLRFWRQDAAPDERG